MLELLNWEMGLFTDVVELVSDSMLGEKDKVTEVGGGGGGGKQKVG